MDRLLWVLLILTLSLFALYTPVNTPRGEIYSFKTIVDDYIPLWTSFLIFYISYYVLLVFTFIYLFRKQKYGLLKNTLVAAIICYSVTYIFYWFFQNGIERPVIINRNVFDAIYTWINSWLAPYNAFPSLHVATSVICAISFYKARSSLFKSVLIWAVLICASTVLTKQHYFLDIPGGVVIGCVSFWIGEYLMKRKVRIW